MKEIYKKETSGIAYFNPIIKIGDGLSKSQDFFFKMEFMIDKNELDVYTKVDDRPWQLWQIKNDNEIKNHNLSVGGGQRLEVKFICQKEGPTCQLRELNLNAELVQ